MREKKSYKDKVIWIIGASSGIGAALASELASRQARLALSARRKDILQNLTESLGSVQHKVFELDVCDPEWVTATAKAIRVAFGRIDSVIFLAGSYTPMKLENLNLTVTQQIIDVNLKGAFHVVHAVLPIFKDQLNGQIALCGSVAGYIGLAGGQPYSATKAGIINLTESLYAEVGSIIDVKLINPGFVRTDLTDKNDFEMPMIITPGEAAKAIADGLLKSGFEVHFPKFFTSVLKLLRMLPYFFSLKLTKKLNS